MKAGSLVGRLAILQQLLAAALIVVFAVSAIWISARTLEREEVVMLDNTTARMARSFRQEWLEDRNLKSAAEAVLIEVAPPGVRIDILDDQGRLLASTASGPRRPSDEVNEDRLHVAPGAWIVASISTRPRRDAVRALSIALLLAAVPLFLLVSLAGRSVARRALRPLSRMAAEAEHLPDEGAVRPLARPEDPTEVAVMAAALDRLVARLDDMVRAERHFTEDAAHELRTPLTVLAGELEFALIDPALDPRHRAGLQGAAHQVRAMSELVEALLFLRNADTGRGAPAPDSVPVNLGDLARDAAHALVREHPERSADLSVCGDDEALVGGHAVLLATALRNLVANALKFTEPGQAVRVTVAAAGDTSRVVVEDAGPGIPAGDRDNIFDPFYRGAEARAGKEGFGLGLPILRRVARAHGGDVAVSVSSLGGARFELCLPAWRPGPLPARAVHSSVVAAPSA